jgi:hypothetical protein
MRHIVICGLPYRKIFLRYPINGTIFEKKKKTVIEHEMVWFSTTFV